MSWVLFALAATNIAIALNVWALDRVTRWRSLASAYERGLSFSAKFIAPIATLVSTIPALGWWSLGLPLAIVPISGLLATTLAGIGNAAPRPIRLALALFSVLTMGLALGLADLLQA